MELKGGKGKLAAAEKPAFSWSQVGLSFVGEASAIAAAEGR
jgi:hypothetical protein